MSSVTGLAGQNANRGLVIARAQSRRANASGVTTALAIDSEGFMRSLVAHLGQMVVESEEQLVTVGLKTQNKARSLCPVDTGRLRSSIIMTKGRDGQGFYVEIGTNVVYARFVEFGTSTTPAQPFLIPALALASGFMSQGAA